MQTSPAACLGSKRRQGFTLIELLVVITIIGVLAALLLGVIGSVQNTARKAQATNDFKNMKVALVSYYNDYRKYPLNDNQSQAVANLGYDTIYGDPGGTYSTADLFDILRAIDDGNFNKNNVLNPNQTVYWDGQLAKSQTNPRGGITTKEVTVNNVKIKQGAFVDPWGHEYLVWVDATQDGDLSTAVGWFYYDMKTPGTVKCGEPPNGYGFGSLGPDGQFGTKGDYKLTGSDDILTTW